MFVALDFFVGELKCRIISIDINNCAGEDARYYDHNHFCTELHWIEEGDSDYICDKKRYHVDAGQFIIIPPGTYHREAGASKNFKKLSILLNISSAKGKTNGLGDRFLQIFCPEEVGIFTADSEELTQIRGKLHKLLEPGQLDSISLERLRVMCNLFFVALLDSMAADSLAKNENNIQNACPEDVLLENHIAYRFMPGASFSALAEQLHVSPRQLHRIITQKYGVNYRDKMKEIRIEIATNFLRNSDKSVAQIAQLMGYSDTSSFSSFMKRATGRSPQQIRKAGKSE